MLPRHRTITASGVVRLYLGLVGLDEQDVTCLVEERPFRQDQELLLLVSGHGGYSPHYHIGAAIYPSTCGVYSSLYLKRSRRRDPGNPMMKNANHSHRPDGTFHSTCPIFPVSLASDSKCHKVQTRSGASPDQPGSVPACRPCRRLPA